MQTAPGCDAPPPRSHDVKAAPPIGTLIDEAARAIGRSGSLTPRLDAEVLLATAAEKTRTWLLTWTHRCVAPAVEERFREMVRRRIAHEPVAYITGHRGFYDLDLAVTPDVLIPRPETETLVEEALRWLKEKPGAAVLDVGTGSGAIAIAIARHAPAASVTATDLHEAALRVARGNAARNGVDGIDWRVGDLYEAVGTMQFDLIVSNPPYVSTEEYEALAPDVRDFEPESALRAPEKGLAVLRRLCEGAMAHLTETGAMGLEIGMTQGRDVARLMSRNGFEATRIVPDLSGRDRIVWGRRWTENSPTK